MKVKIPECENRFYSCFELEDGHINFCVSGPTFFNESSFNLLVRTKKPVSVKSFDPMLLLAFQPLFCADCKQT